MHTSSLCLLTLIRIVGNLVSISAQFPPTPEGITVLHSRFDDDVYISYKEIEVCNSQINTVVTEY